MIYGLIMRLKSMIDTKVTDLKIMGSVTKEPVTFDKRFELRYKQLKIGESWGNLFDCAWFQLTGKVDRDLSGDIYLKLDLNAEALLFDNDGRPIIGFTSKSSAFGFLSSLGTTQKRYFKVNDYIQEDGSLELWIDVGMNDLFGNVKRKGRIEIVELVKRDSRINSLYYDLKVLEALRRKAFKRDKEAFKKYNIGIKEIVKVLKNINNEAVDKAKKLTEKLLNEGTKLDHYISSIGHAHLDLAWLWPIRETKRKGARTFSNVLRLMERYDDYHFGASQPQLYKWIKEEYPQLYEEIKVRIQEGRWEVQGGMWVEADTNITGEESLVRQMLYGIRFFKEEFDIRVKSLWLPDVFGYSGNMPQIIKKSGLDNFMTIKISWNDTNKFPHHTFNWVGIDNSEVLAHMPPEDQYNSPVNALHILKSVENYREKHLDNKTLNLFGIGNGGGGPSDHHVERIRRFNNSSPMPHIKMEPSYKFFKRLNKNKEKFPRYKGELYLEKHRGTYTSKGNIKYYNRKLEQKLKTVETMLVQTNNFSIYKDEIKKIWEEVLLYQFHDILPGSSIKRVYDECLDRYKTLNIQLNNIIDNVLGKQINNDFNIKNITVYNPLLIPSTVRKITNEFIHEFKVAPQSTKILKHVSYEKKSIEYNGLLENDKLRIKFSKDGSINSVIKKDENIEVLKSKGSIYRVYKDIANAWDIFKYYKWLPSSKMKLFKKEAYSYGSTIEYIHYYKYRKSTLIQKIYLYDNASYIDFDVSIDWQDNRKMLRTAFPLTLKTKEAVFDIQFGHIKRSTLNKTKQEKAQYEASGHNWVDMNNNEWGASIITDSKYGFKAKNNTLDLNLLKTTTYPATNGDIGTHHMKYAFLVHDGNHIDGELDEFGMKYNTYYPITNNEISIDSLFTLSNNKITYSSIKESEDSDDIIIRLYEKDGLMTETKLIVNKENISLFETNMVEENEEIISESNEALLKFEPFMVKTIKIKKK